MADDSDNLVLRLLREIRAEVSDVRADTLDIRARVIRLERHADEMKESMVHAMGFAAHAAQVSEGHGERFDEIRDEIAALKNRVRELEQARRT